MHRQRQLDAEDRCAEEQSLSAQLLRLTPSRLCAQVMCVQDALRGRLGVGACVYRLCGRLQVWVLAMRSVPAGRCIRQEQTANN